MSVLSILKALPPNESPSLSGLLNLFASNTVNGSSFSPLSLTNPSLLLQQWRFGVTNHFSLYTYISVSTPTVSLFLLIYLVRVFFRWKFWLWRWCPQIFTFTYLNDIHRFLLVLFTFIFNFIIVVECSFMYLFVLIGEAVVWFWINFISLLGNSMFKCWSRFKVVLVRKTVSKSSLESECFFFFFLFVYVLLCICLACY